MDAIPELEAAFATIRRVIAQQRDAAAKEAIERLVSAATANNSTAQSESLPPAESTGGKVRAGVAKALVIRVMEKFGKSGIAASNIKDYAETDEERALSPSTIRLELTKGRDDDPARYRNAGGKWYQA